MSEGMGGVRRICEGWPDMSTQEWSEICTSDVRYQNMPWDRTVHEGPDAIHKALRGFAGKFDVTMDVEQLAGDEQLIFAERTEHFTPKTALDGKSFDLPVAGVFEMRDGKVSAWRDYFDRQAMKD